MIKKKDFVSKFKKEIQDEIDAGCSKLYNTKLIVNEDS